ncbi:uncharacterized protein LOC142819360 [Pelodiscus sinensis]|uniref:uncharacterized protein LOC142819360 n=1 Tax=Pelodiscus sinensis TaxID=13735 RepID=UPI003F6CB837
MENYLAAEGEEDWRQGAKNQNRSPGGHAPLKVEEQGPAHPSCGHAGERRQTHGVGEPGGNGTRRGRGTSPSPAEPGKHGACFECGQEGHFRRECPFMDCSVGRASTTGKRPPRAGPPRLTLQVSLDGRATGALVDSGCNQTRIREEEAPRGREGGPPVTVQCIHGEVRRYPTRWVQIGEGPSRTRCRVAVAPHLAYPVILGRDWPGFRQAIQQWGWTPGGAVPPVAPEVGDQDGPTEAQAGETPPPGAPGSRIGEGEDFLREQREDRSLAHAWEQAQAETPPGCPLTQSPRFEVKKLRTSVYHLQTDRLVERFNKTPKTMLRKLVGVDPREWDRFLPALLFAV